MGLVIGMDEAGYGPNLGPLVITATAWEVPCHPHQFDFWSSLQDVVSQSRNSGESKLHVADSKEVYSPSRGLSILEKSTLCLLGLVDWKPRSLLDLWSRLTCDQTSPWECEPWFQEADVTLPVAAERDAIASAAESLQACCSDQNLRLRAVRSEIVLTERFNRLTSQFDSKGVALSRLSCGLLRQLWNPEDDESTLIVADKHGGRNRYDGFLAEVVDDQFIFRIQEGREQSEYKVGNSTIRFQTRAESHFPVAVASLISKYVRELTMQLFNEFWLRHVPNLNPTKGYPVDALRFRDDVATVRKQLQISDDCFWRQR